MKIQVCFWPLFAGSVALALASPVFAQQSADRLANADSSFVTSAARGGLAEVQMGQLATQNAENSDVKSFAQHMVDDHSKANNELQGIASRKSVTVPDKMDAKDQATYDRLSKLHGAAFDRAYMADMVRDHRTAIAEFQRESTSGADAEVKDFATKTLPTLRTHLKMAESADQKVRK